MIFTKLLQNLFAFRGIVDVYRKLNEFSIRYTISWQLLRNRYQVVRNNPIMSTMKCFQATLSMASTESGGTHSEFLVKNKLVAAYSSLGVLLSIFLIERSRNKSEYILILTIANTNILLTSII